MEPTTDVYIMTIVVFAFLFFAVAIPTKLSFMLIDWVSKRIKDGKK